MTRPAVINGERSAMSSPDFKHLTTITRKGLMQQLLTQSKSLPAGS